jgi:hypothetical protein
MWLRDVLDFDLHWSQSFVAKQFGENVIQLCKATAQPRGGLMFSIYNVVAADT